MKFLCVSCDEAMKLKGTKGPDGGSLTVIFECPACGWETAMLTNTMETQMVRSLGVKIGGKTVPGKPMEMVQNSLAHGHASPRDDAQPADATVGDPSAEPKCPFSGMVEEAFARNKGKTITWTKEAQARMASVPEFAQPMAKKGVEMHAIENGYTEVDDAVLDEVKDRFGM